MFSVKKMYSILRYFGKRFLQARMYGLSTQKITTKKTFIDATKCCNDLSHTQRLHFEITQEALQASAPTLVSQR